MQPSLQDKIVIKMNQSVHPGEPFTSHALPKKAILACRHWLFAPLGYYLSTAIISGGYPNH